MQKSKKPRIFICYAKEDREGAGEVYEMLELAGGEPWIDQHNLLPGDDWEGEIQAAVSTSNAFVVCLSKRFDKVGYRQTEIRLAFKALDKRPPGKGFIVPYVLEPCDIPAWCEGFHVGDPSSPTSFDQLIRAINKHCQANLNTLTSSKLPFESRKGYSSSTALSAELTQVLESNDPQEILERFRKAPIEQKLRLKETIYKRLCAWISMLDESGNLLEKLLLLCDKIRIPEAIPQLLGLCKSGLIGHPREKELRRFSLRIISNIGTTLTLQDLFVRFLYDADYTDIALRGLTKRGWSKFIWAFPISIKAVGNDRRQAFLKRAVRTIFWEDLQSGSARFGLIEKIFQQDASYPLVQVLKLLRDWAGLTYYFSPDSDVIVNMSIGFSKSNELYTIGRMSSSQLNRFVLDRLLIEQAEIGMTFNRAGGLLDDLLK